GDIGPPRDIDKLARSTDLLPTLIDLCGLHKPDQTGFDGISLSPYLVGNTDVEDDRICVIEYDSPYRPDENRDLRWRGGRLVKNEELYNLTKDPGQSKDIAKDYPDVFDKMMKFYRDWEDEVLPNYNKKRYIHIGSKHQNPVILYASDWLGSYADGIWNLLE